MCFLKLIEIDFANRFTYRIFYNVTFQYNHIIIYIITLELLLITALLFIYYKIIIYEKEKNSLSTNSFDKRKMECDAFRDMKLFISS